MPVLLVVALVVGGWCLMVGVGGWSLVLLVSITSSQAATRGGGGRERAGSASGSQS